MSTRVLISGGGIAGLALGFWLDRLGIETVVVDRVPRFEALGHYIALEGNGVEVIRQMGLEGAFVFADAIAQVRMPAIVKGRVALLGDAAHCPTFMSGMGSSLALQGARALAAQIEHRPGELAQALLSYQAAIAPVAERYHASARRMRAMLLDRRPWVSYGRDLAFRLTPEWLMARQTRRFYHAENLARV